MRAPRYRFGGLPGGWFAGVSWVGALNMALLQWLFIRLELTTEDEAPQDVSRVAVLFPVVPLTGWQSEYVPLRPRRFTLWRASVRR